MHIELTNSYAYVREATDSEVVWLVQYLSVELEQKHQRRALAAHLLDELPTVNTFCAFNPLNHCFPTGLAIALPRVAQQAGIEVEVTDSRERVCAPDLQRTHVAWLRDVQWDTVCKVIKRGGRGLIKAITGAGKTEMFIALTRLLDCEWLYVVHRSDLPAQTAERYTLRTGEVAGTFDAGAWRKGTCNVTVATFQSLMSALRRHGKNKPPLRRGDAGIEGLLEGIEAIYVDEVHSTSGDTYASTIMMFDRAYYRIGASSTPLERSAKDRLQTLGVCGPILAEVKHSELADLQLLARADIRMIPCDQWASREHDWREVYLRLIVHSERRNRLIMAMIEACQKPAFVFVEELDHAQLLLNASLDSGIRTEVVNGNVLIKQRLAAVKRLVAGEIEVIISTVVFQEGIDVPELASIVVAGGKAAAVACLQRLGRPMRVPVSGHKPTFEVWDVLDTGHWWTEKHALSRKDIYEKAGHTVHARW